MIVNCIPFLLDTVCSAEQRGFVTVESFGEEEQADAEEDEQIDDLLAVILDVVTNVFQEDRPSRR